MLIDTHCHLDSKDFDKDREEVIKRARKVGVQKMINVGCDIEQSKNSIALAEKYDFIYAAVGLHPHEVVQLQLFEDDADNFIFMELEKLAEHPKVMAIGECGLEYFRIRANELEVKNKQEHLFKKQIELSIKVSKPLIIHCRNIHEDVINILDSYSISNNPKPYGIIHFFSGSLEQAEKYLELGFMLSFAGPITFTQEYDRVIQMVPFNKILIETDAPFATPIPYRGKRNEPAYVIEIAKKIAEIKNMSFEEVAKQTTGNAIKVFSL